MRKNAREKLVRFFGCHRIEVIDRAALFAIREYQRTLSPDHGPLRHNHPYGYCRFYPTCSEYGYQSIEKYGLVVGSVMTGWRILRCNPFAKGGIDPVPKIKIEERC